MRENHFDETIAATYDEDSAEMFEPELLDATVDVLAELAGEGRALELAIGTGRVAVPLAARGVHVSGIELSSAMLDRLRAKEGAADIEAVEGDMVSTRVDGEFSLVYLVFNTITNLTTQDEQVACFENAAAHLAPGGSFVIEVFVPILQKLPPGRAVPRLRRGAGLRRLRRVRRRDADLCSPTTSGCARTAPTAAPRCPSATPGRPSST